MGKASDPAHKSLMTRPPPQLLHSGLPSTRTSPGAKPQLQAQADLFRETPRASPSPVNIQDGGLSKHFLNGYHLPPSKVMWLLMSLSCGDVPGAADPEGSHRTEAKIRHLCPAPETKQKLGLCKAGLQEYKPERRPVGQ